jgi:pyruvate carboxylase subunit B
MPVRSSGNDVKYTVTVHGRPFEITVTGSEVTVGGKRVSAVMDTVPHTPLRVLRLNGRSYTLAVIRENEGWLVQMRGERWHVVVEDERTRALKKVTGRGAGQLGVSVVKAPMPGLVIRVEVEVGQQVDARAGVVVLEAMKMENEITSPGAGVVSAVHVAAGQTVEKGAPLVEVRRQG